MSKSKSVVYGVVINDEHQFSLWPTHRRLPPGWHFTGPTGTQAEMRELMRQQFIETVPATYIAAGKRFPASRWAD